MYSAPYIIVISSTFYSTEIWTGELIVYYWQHFILRAVNSENSNSYNQPMTNYMAQIALQKYTAAVLQL